MSTEGSLPARFACGKTAPLRYRRTLPQALLPTLRFEETDPETPRGGWLHTCFRWVPCQGPSLTEQPCLPGGLECAVVSCVRRHACCVHVCLLTHAPQV